MELAANQFIRIFSWIYTCSNARGILQVLHNIHYNSLTLLLRFVAGIYQVFLLTKQWGNSPPFLFAFINNGKKDYRNTSRAGKGAYTKLKKKKLKP